MADTTLWLAAVGIALALGMIAVDSRGIPSVAGRLGLTAQGVGPWWLILLAAALAGGTIAARRWLVRLGWPLLQLLSALVALAWTTLLVLARHSAFPAEPPTAFLGAWYGETLTALSRESAVLAALAVGATAALAVVFVNAAVQSLAGGIQARRFAWVAPLLPLAGWIVDANGALTMLWTTGVVALGAMASERGRGLAWSSGLGLLSGLLLAGAALTSFAATSAGVGLLCIYFLRRRSLMIIVSSLGLLIGLGVAAIIGWSWPEEFGEASAARIGSAADLVVMAILIAVLVIAGGGVATVLSLRKARCSPAWPLLVTGAVGLLIGIFTLPAYVSPVAALAPWQVFLLVGCVSAPARTGRPSGPSVSAAVVTAAAGLLATTAAMIIG